MKIVHIIGQPGSGKTTLVGSLVRHFTNQGLAAGTLKHSSHNHELDKPGKDSHVHRTAGASPAAMVTSKMAALYFPASEQTRPDNLIKHYFGHADIVLIEGWISGPYPKIEIWRESVGKPPLFSGVQNARALATDDVIETGAPAGLDILPLTPVSEIADYVLSLN